MVLTPEDVVEKRFQPTKFREGYDQDEVDDFLDEVVAELRRLTALNDELQTNLDACERQVESLGASPADRSSVASGSGVAPAAGGTTADDAVLVPDGASDPPPPAAEGSEQPAAAVAEPAAAATQPGTDAMAAATMAGAAPDGGAPEASEEGPQAVAGMIALAQKLHDDYVRDGEAERDRVVAEAQEHATRLVHDAEEKQRQTLGSLEQERGLLERKIDELRSFERDYRARLKAYLEGQLRDLDSKGSVLPNHGPTPEAAGAGD